MKNIARIITCALSAPIILSQFSYAQETTLALKPPPAAVTIDGKNTEWGDNLAYHNTENNIHYAISNDKEYLYLVIKTNDEKQLNNILFGGVTFSIDTKGRKKKAYSVTFPQKLAPLTNVPLNTPEQKRAFATKTNGSRKISVNGFKKDVDENELYPGNAYRIQTALNFDDKGYLIYEEAIPLYLFHAEGQDNSEWSYNIMLNAVVGRLPENGQITLGNFTVQGALVAVPAGSGPPSSSSSKVSRNSSASATATNTIGQMPEVELTKAIEFWGKLSLSK